MRSKNKIEIKGDILWRAQNSKDPESYILSTGLKEAVEAAIKLNQPLLLTGEPGTGKTSLAYKVAYDLSQSEASDYIFNSDPFVFNTKTNSTARDLFYQYDAVNHFYKASLRELNQEAYLDPLRYVRLQALGKAIAMSNPEKKVHPLLRRSIDSFNKSSVVLIDEVDKAPRDFVNDILNEVDVLEFSIPEADNLIVSKAQSQKVVLILTSNSEKNLPDPFLRRCVFFHIPFPSREDLVTIVASQLHYGGIDSYVTWVDLFLEIRDMCAEKKPSTAELISWLKILELDKYFEKGFDLRTLSSDQRKILGYSSSVLAKTRRDLENVNQLFHLKARK